MVCQKPIDAGNNWGLALFDTILSQLFQALFEVLSDLIGAKSIFILADVLYRQYNIT